MVAGHKLAVRMPLPEVEMWEDLQADVERWTGEAGLQILRALLEDEVTRRVGPPYRPDPAAGMGVAAHGCCGWRIYITTLIGTPGKTRHHASL